jgi:hypothetical protein
MKPVQPEELSALLDGEIDAQRAREISEQVRNDPVLSPQLEALEKLDSDLRRAADAAIFIPSMRLPPFAHVPAVSTVTICCIVFLLLFVRLLSKVLDAQALTWGLNAGAFIVVLVAAVGLLRVHGRASERWIS